MLLPCKLKFLAFFPFAPVRGGPKIWTRVVLQCGLVRVSTEDFHALQKSDLLTPSNGSRFDLGELFLGVVDGAVTKPARAIKQLVSDSHSTKPSQPPCETDKIKNSELQSKPSYCRKTGEVVGSLVPFVTLVGLTRGASTELLGWQATFPKQAATDARLQPHFLCP